VRREMGELGQPGKVLSLKRTSLGDQSSNLEQNKRGKGRGAQLSKNPSFRSGTWNDKKGCKGPHLGEVLQMGKSGAGF